MVVPLVPLWTVPAEPISMDAYPTLDLGSLPSAALKAIMTDGCGRDLPKKDRHRLRALLRDISISD